VRYQDDRTVTVILDEYGRRAPIHLSSVMVEIQKRKLHTVRTTGSSLYISTLLDGVQMGGLFITGYSFCVK
jgi:hypothetical protein